VKNLVRRCSRAMARAFHCHDAMWPAALWLFAPMAFSWWWRPWETSSSGTWTEEDHHKWQEEVNQ
jgi:hypothetical protein